MDWLIPILFWTGGFFVGIAVSALVIRWAMSGVGPKF